MADGAGLEVRVFETRDALGRAAAADVAAAIKAVLARQDTARIVFAAAPSQTEMLDGLVAAPGIDWSRVTAFHMDEYIGLPAGAPQRFGMWLDRHLFGRVPLGVVQFLGELDDPAAEAARYAALLAAAPVDIVCLGIGVNGHLAFNDPPVADFADRRDVKLVKLDAVCRQQQVDDGGFPTVAAVPRHALTLTIPRLLAAERLFCAVPGPAKRAAVAAALYGPIAESCPASALRTHPACRLYLDQDSAPVDARPLPAGA